MIMNTERGHFQQQKLQGTPEKEASSWLLRLFPVQGLDHVAELSVMTLRLSFMVWVSIPFSSVKGP